MSFNGEGLFSDDSEVEDFDVGHFFSNVFKSRTASQEGNGARHRSPGYRNSPPKKTASTTGYSGREHHEPVEGHVGRKKPNFGGKCYISNDVYILR